MKESKTYYLRISFIVIILLLIGYGILSRNKSESDEKITVRIDVKSLQQRELLKKYLNQHIDLDKIKHIEASISWEQFFKLQKEGLDPALQLEVDRNKLIDPQYHTFSEITELINSYKHQFPDIVHVEKIGEGTEKHLPIWGIKISDNPHRDETEPAVLFTSIHHAKELLGAEVCLYLLKDLCQNYYDNSRVKHWIDEAEIWIVPVLNPDGYHLVMDSENSLQFWRKNLRDNNANGIFDPEKDGVDLSRNYDYNWDGDSDSDPRSWYYRGSFPFSEKETQAIRDLTLRERFVFHLDFHSYGEVVLYPWKNFPSPPDEELVVELANEIAKRISRTTQLDHYSIKPLNGKLGQSAIWMHGRAGVLSYIIEVGDSHFPNGRYISQIVSQNAKAAFYVLDRLFKSAIKGVIRNAYNKVPISAELEITRYASPLISNPVSDASSGYFYRVVQPGIYSIKFSAPGFRTKVVHSIKIESDKITTLNVELYPIKDILPTEN